MRLASPKEWHLLKALGSARGDAHLYIVLDDDRVCVIPMKFWDNIGEFRPHKTSKAYWLFEGREGARGDYRRRLSEGYIATKRWRGGSKVNTIIDYLETFWEHWENNK